MPGDIFWRKCATTAHNGPRRRSLASSAIAPSDHHRSFRSSLPRLLLCACPLSFDPLCCFSPTHFRLFLLIRPGQSHARAQPHPYCLHLDHPFRLLAACDDARLRPNAFSFLGGHCRGRRHCWPTHEPWPQDDAEVELLDAQRKQSHAVPTHLARRQEHHSSYSCA